MYLFNNIIEREAFNVEQTIPHLSSAIALRNSELYFDLMQHAGSCIAEECS